MAYISGTGTTIFVYTINRRIYSSETGVTVTYVQPVNGVEDLVGNDLANFTNRAVTNSSTIKQISGGISGGGPAGIGGMSQ
jgi:hypothetical protein